MDIERAARSLACDFRRHCGLAASQRISDLVEPLVKEPQLDTSFRAVSGSTARNTHLPNSPDFDVGLVPKDRDADYPAILGELTSSLATAILADRQLLSWLSLTHSVGAAELEACFRGGPAEVRDRRSEKEVPIDLVTARFKIGDDSLLDVSVGRAASHLIGLLYHKGWQDWIASIGRQRSQEQSLSEVCLFKLLAQNYGCYGRSAGGLSSAGCEQLLLGMAEYAEAGEPLIRALARGVSISKGLDDLIIEIPVKVSCLHELGVSGAEIIRELKGAWIEGDRIRRPAIKSPAVWTKFKEMADVLLADEFVALAKCWRGCPPKYGLLSQVRAP